MRAVDPTTGKVQTLISGEALALAERITKLFSQLDPNQEKDSFTYDLLMDIMNRDQNLRDAYDHAAAGVVMGGSYMIVDEDFKVNPRFASAGDFASRCETMILDALVRNRDFNLLIANGRVDLFVDDQMIKLRM